MFAWHDTSWMWFSMVLFWSLIGFFFYYALKGAKSPAPGKNSPRASEILEQRFANGDISAEEYRDRRETLKGGRAGAGDGSPPRSPRPRRR